MNAHRHGPGGFLLLPVSLLLAVIGALSYMLVQDIGSAARPGGREAERARLVAEAGLAHATWKLNQVSGCSGYSPQAATPFGSGGDQYQVALSTASGSPVTLTATSTLAGTLAGSQASIRRTVYKTSGNTLTYTLSTDSRGSDTNLEADTPDKNYGGKSILTLKQGTSLPLLQFDLSLIPVGSRIIEAKLLLYRENPGSFTLSARAVNAHRVLEPWLAGSKDGSSSADGATWLTRDGSVAWKSASGTVDSANATDTPHIHYYIWGTPWMEWNLTSLVQGWVDRRYPNYGVMLRPSTSVSTEEYTAAEGDSAQVPKLAIKYVAPCGAINPPQDGIGGRVAWWKFNESTGTTAADAIGGHPGSVSGGTWSATGGVSGGALAFNSAGKVSVAHTDDLSQTGDFSLGAWVNLSDPNGKRSILHKGTASNEANYAMGVRDGNLYFEYFANSAWRTYITTGLNLQAGTYYHLTATYKSSTRQIKLYVDGIPAGTFTASFGNTPKSNTKALLIGTTPSNENFLGRIDDVQIVASNLDATGVATLMGGSVRIPAADTHVSAEPSARNFNYGGATLMQLKYPPDIRPLVRFDLSAVPAGTPIKRAILSFHVQDSVIISLGLKAYAYPLTESWLEGTQNGAVSTLGATWSKRQIGPDLAWGSAGGTYHNVAAGVFQVPLGATPQRYWEMDITSTVKEWVDGVRANHGLTLLLDFSLDSANLSSRESPRLEPRLVISTQ